jgi:hypothetical protein
VISLNKLVLEILTENDGKANFTKIFEVLMEKRPDIKINSKIPEKTVRGVLSKMKKENKIFKDGLNFWLLK